MIYLPINESNNSSVLTLALSGVVIESEFEVVNDRTLFKNGDTLVLVGVVVVHIRVVRDIP